MDPIQGIHMLLQWQSCKVKGPTSNHQLYSPPFFR